MALVLPHIMQGGSEGQGGPQVLVARDSLLSLEAGPWRQRGVCQMQAPLSEQHLGRTVGPRGSQLQPHTWAWVPVVPGLCWVGGHLMQGPPILRAVGVGPLSPMCLQVLSFWLGAIALC